MVVKCRHFEACISGEFSVLGGVQHHHSPFPMFSSPRKRPAPHLPVPTLGRVSPSPWVCPWEGVAGSRGHSAARCVPQRLHCGAPTSSAQRFSLIAPRSH